MAKFVSIMSASEDHPIFIDVDNILMLGATEIIFVAGETAKCHTIWPFHYNKIVEKIKECLPYEWIELGYAVPELGPLFINKKYFKGLNFADDNYDMIFERGNYTQEITIPDLSIDDAIKIIDAISD